MASLKVEICLKKKKPLREEILLILGQSPDCSEVYGAVITLKTKCNKTKFKKKSKIRMFLRNSSPHTPYRVQKNRFRCS